MSFPRVPDDMKKTLHDFLVKSQRELDRELSRRPKTQDGVMYVGDESPLALTEGLDSTPFFLAIVDGKLVLKDEAGNVVFSGLGDSDLAANGGTVPETDRVNNFALMQQVAGADIVQTGSNANGSWTQFSTGLLVCQMEQTFSVVSGDWASLGTSGLSWVASPAFTFPQTFADLPVIAVTTDQFVWTRDRGNSYVTTTGIGSVDMIRESAANFTDMVMRVTAIGVAA